MTNLDSVCEEIVRKATQDQDFVFEKKAEVLKTVVKKFTLPENINLEKIAAQIREELAPKELTYADMANFYEEVGLTKVAGYKKVDIIRRAKNGLKGIIDNAKKLTDASTVKKGLKKEYKLTKEYAKEKVPSIKNAVGTAATGAAGGAGYAAITGNKDEQ